MSKGETERGYVTWTENYLIRERIERALTNVFRNLTFETERDVET
jgi:hypothetical protein